MAGSTNKLRVELEGKDKSLGRSFKKAGADASTFSGKLKLIRQGFGQLIRGDFKGLGSSLKSLAAGFSGFAAIATAGLAAVAVGVAALIVFIFKAKAAYESWMQKLDDFQDVTGLTAKTTSLLAFQARMADADLGAMKTGVAKFTRVMDAARSGTAAAIDPFKRLGISLRDSDGSMRSLNDVLFEARDKLSAVKDQVTRNGIAAKLFGRGFAGMADWLDKSSQKMAEYTKWAYELGMVMGEKSMSAFQKYRENQRRLSVGFDAIKINAYGAFVPLINRIMPSVIKVIWKAAGWVGKFRRMVEKKGWGAAIREMIPGVERVWGALSTAWDYAKKFGAYIVAHKGEIVASFRDILTMVQGIADAINATVAAARYLAGTVNNTHAPAPSGKGRIGRALGGTAWGPKSGYPVTLHGTETVVAHDNPRRGLRDLARAGILADGGGTTPEPPSVTVAVYLDSEPIAARVEVRQAQRDRRNARTLGLAPS